MSRFRIQDKNSGKFMADSDDVTKALKGLELMIGDKSINTNTISQANISAAIANAEQLETLYKANKSQLDTLRKQLDGQPESERKRLENEEGVMMFTLIKERPDMYKKLLPTLLAIYTKFGFSRLTKALANDQVGYDSPTK